ncbi:hypothetical protein L6452_35343 [Arctium lappa]|uniref:Uncharacterized protein n=1 Tax=Arctium lappa TaxID=4217 RepID=A0ACB8Y5J7_ARCLA|nr:hypothetical protein L6452_35343 [Arctium lappa]
MHIQHTADDHRGGRHQRQHHHAQYNKHHAQESLTTRVSKLICAVFLSILFTVGLVTFILWLSLRPHRPRFHIHEFSIPSLAEPNGFSNVHVTYNVTAQNPNLDIGIYYDTMNLTLYYQDQTIAETPLLFPFYQSSKNTAIVYGTLSGPTLRINYARWIQLLAARKQGSVPFRLDVASSIRFKVSAWDSRHHKMHANCEIGVGSNGMLLESDKEKKCPIGITICYVEISVKVHEGGSVVGNKSLVAFCQGRKNSVTEEVVIGGDQQLRGGGVAGDGGLRMTVETVFKYRVLNWKTKIRHMGFEGFVRSGSEGNFSENIYLHKIP